MSPHLVPLIAAGATWLDRTYGCRNRSPILAVLADVQLRQAMTVAAWLRYPTGLDAALVHLAGPGGADRLDARLGLPADTAAEAWRTWVDAAAVSWAACLLADPRLAAAAVAAAAGTEHGAGLCLSFRSLLSPDAQEARAAALVRHPDLVEPVARLHRPELLARLLP